MHRAPRLLYHTRSVISLSLLIPSFASLALHPVWNSISLESGIRYPDVHSFVHPARPIIKSQPVTFIHSIYHTRDPVLHNPFILYLHLRIRR